MTAETQSASLVSLLSMPSYLPQGYYRSKLFTQPIKTNPILAAAGPILSLIERLTQSPNLPSIETIRDNIEHELFAFHSRLKGEGYNDELIMLAHYILTATIDELLGKNYVRLYDKSPDFKAFTPLSADNIGPETRFFQIVTHIKSRATQYLDLIELAYYCLIGGFEGEYHIRADGRLALDNMIEELYQIIEKNRVYQKNKLFKAKTLTQDPPKNYRILLNFSAIAIAVFTLCFFLSHVYLENKAHTILKKHSTNLQRDISWMVQ